MNLMLIYKMYEDGESLRDICKRLNLNFRQVRDGLVKAGFTLRNKSEAQKNFLKKKKDDDNGTTG